jgi:hypothetical protein
MLVMKNTAGENKSDDTSLIIDAYALEIRRSCAVLQCGESRKRWARLRVIGTWLGCRAERWCAHLHGTEHVVHAVGLQRIVLAYSGGATTRAR